jgi:hypothetical protein
LNQVEHYVVDSPTLLTMGGNKQVSGLIQAAASSDDVRLWVPVLCLVEAERERAGIVAHAATIPPEAYPGLGVGVMDLNR